jgi:hypothetical protein
LIFSVFCSYQPSANKKVLSLCARKIEKRKKEKEIEKSAAMPWVIFTVEVDIDNIYSAVEREEIHFYDENSRNMGTVV